jgi:hypothetical protein
MAAAAKQVSCTTGTPPTITQSVHIALSVSPVLGIPLAHYRFLMQRFEQTWASGEESFPSSLGQHWPTLLRPVCRSRPHFVDEWVFLWMTAREAFRHI